MEHIMELKGKYAKLRDDLKIALAAGEAVENTFNFDGGTCNFDSPTLLLPRWKRELVEQAVREAGTRCFKSSSGWWNGAFVISPRTHSQGYPRTKNAEEVYKILKAAGYDASVYYQMD